MPKLSSISVKYRGGFRGSYIDVTQLIDKRVRVDVIDFKKKEKSNVRNCDFYCRMQLRISGVLCVTWHSSEVLTNFLEDCREHQQDTGEVVFPIECCMFSVGDDRAYYLIDAPDDAFVPTERELEKMFDKARRNKR